MKIATSVVALLMVVIAALGFVGPRDFDLEREIIVDQPLNQVFQHVKLVNNHQIWSPWAKKDPNMKVETKGTDGTVGFISSWSGNSDVGEGEQEIKNIEEGKRIDIELRFKKPMENVAQSYITTEAISPNQTKVKWGMKGHNKFPYNIICMLMNMKGKLEADFDAGLKNLKAELEKK